MARLLTFAAEAAGGVPAVLAYSRAGCALSSSAAGRCDRLVHAGNGWVFTAPNGGWEYPAYLVILCVVQAMLGDGVLALGATPLARPARLRRHPKHSTEIDFMPQSFCETTDQVARDAEADRQLLARIAARDGARWRSYTSATAGESGHS